MNIRSALLSIAVALFSTSFVSADPVPIPPAENRFSIMQTLEMTFHMESPLDQHSMNTWIIYGGPSLVYIWIPDEIVGSGIGLELGGELRKYFIEPYSGIFFGAYMGAGILFRTGEEHIEAISSGLKLGWRIPLIRAALPLDLEPYIGVGIKLLSNENDVWGENYSHVTLYLGTKVELY
ncbi:MAG: hypothetical protein K8S15_12115 [Candidatus Aegiribacteria sp.]|nr:hypothetical protein [Candidatus Aegiribacteria sp.]